MNVNRKALLVAILLLTVSAFAQKPGQLTPKIPLDADATQTYALYMPAHYDLSAKLPIIFVLDPGGRGATAAAHFKAVADKFGFAVVASNVAKNGPPDPALKALSLMSADAEAKFPLDGHRRYVAGFSGQARTAVIAGMICPKCFAGILGFGAGFPVGPKITEVQFPFLAGVGIGDFNYPEVVALDEQLKKMKAPVYRVLTFDGGHDWPSDAAMIEAFSWMQFQAVKAGAAEKPKDWPNADFDARLASAQKLVSANPQQAAREFDSITRDFQGLHDTNAASQQASAIRGSSDFKKSQKDDKLIAQKADEMSGHFDMCVETLVNAHGAFEKQEPRTAAVQDINRMQADASSKDKFGSVAAKRALSSSYVTLLQRADDLKPNQAETAVDLAELAVLLRPDSPEAFYWLGLAQTNFNHKKQAITALKKAVDLGVPKSQISGDERFKPLAGEADFKTLVAN